MEKYEIGGFLYELVENYKDGFGLEEVRKRYTDYFLPYDYILGDYAYGSLRLKGFCEKGNPCYKTLNDISMVHSYIKEHCSYECKYFLLKKEVKK